MKRILSKQTQGRKKKPSPQRRTKRREIEPKAHIIERKTTRTSSATTKSKPQATKKKKATAASKTSSVSTRKAKKIGRAVGTILGKVIGTVEHTVAKVIPGPKSRAAKKPR